MRVASSAADFPTNGCRSSRDGANHDATSSLAVQGTEYASCRWASCLKNADGSVNEVLYLFDAVLKKRNTKAVFELLAGDGTIRQ